MEIEPKRAYQFIKEEKKQGSYVVLVDRLWPRGISKARLKPDEWAKHLAPSDELRKWFAHKTERWPEFRQRYREELKPFTGELERLRQLAQKRRLILLYGARNTEHNQAVVLREMILQGNFRPGGES